MSTYYVRNMLSKRLNETVIVLDSQRQPGYCLKFNHTTKNLYRCIRCYELGKQRTIAVVDGKVVGSVDESVSGLAPEMSARGLLSRSPTGCWSTAEA